MCDQENSQPFKETDGRGTKMEIKLLFCDNCMNNCACHFATTAAFFRLLLLRLLSSASKDRHLRTVWIANYYTCENRLNFSLRFFLRKQQHTGNNHIEKSIEFQNSKKSTSETAIISKCSQCELHIICTFELILRWKENNNFDGRNKNLRQKTSLFAIVGECACASNLNRSDEIDCDCKAPRTCSKIKLRSCCCCCVLLFLDLNLFFLVVQQQFIKKPASKTVCSVRIYNKTHLLHCCSSRMMH